MSTVRTQYLSYKFLQNVILSPTEHALLNIIMIRPNYCLENLAKLGEFISRSARTVQRTIEKLVQKGIITKKYTTFKRIILSINSLEAQEKIAEGGIISQVFRFCSFKKKKKSPDTTSVSDLNTTSVSEPIKSSNEINSILNAGKNLLKNKTNFEDEKRRQLLRYAEYLKTVN